MPKYDNSDRLKTVGDKDWCEALDELTTYLRWRLRGKTQWDAHSVSMLETGVGKCQSMRLKRHLGRFKDYRIIKI